MMTEPTSHRRQAFLRLLPGVVLVACAAIGGAWALAHHKTEFSSLDNRELAEFQFPTVSGVLDKSWMDSFDSYVDDRLPARDGWLEFHAATVTRALQDPVLNEVYVGANSGHLLEKPLHQPARDTLDEEAEALATAASDADAELLWVYAPRREEVFADELPAAWDNPYLARKDTIVEALASTGDPVLDVSEEVSAPQVRDSNFFLTDHHWTAAGAQTATAAIVEQLAAQGVELGTDDREYHAANAQYEFVGSVGREVTLGAASAEPFVYEVPDGGWRARICTPSGCDLATFDEAQANDSNPYANRYGAFIGGDRGLTHIYNSDPAASGSVVLVKDSYGNAVATYLAERVKDLYVVDERHYTGDPLGQLFAQTGADAVVVLHNQVSLLSQAFASDVWLNAPVGDWQPPHPVDATVAQVATYPQSQVIDAAGTILSDNADQPLDSSLGEDAQALSDAMKAVDVPLAWFYVPRKEESFADKLTASFGNPLDDKRQEVLGYLDVGDPLIDLTPVMSDPSSRDSYYFHTDHHPTWEGAKVVTDAIVDQLAAQGTKIGPAPAWGDVKSVTLPFFGSQITQVPDGVAIPGDSIEWREPLGGWQARLCNEQSCDGSTIFSSWFEDPQWDVNRYKGFLGQGFDPVHFHNDAAHAQGTLVLLKDSFSHLVAMQLAEQVSDLYLVDERGWEGGPLAAYVQDVNADAVVVAHNQASLLSAAFNRTVWSDAGASE